jgi:nitrogen fixation protein FixH
MQNSSPRPSDRWIPWIIVSFFVAFIIPLTWFTWLSIETYTGQVTSNAYQKGLAYNDTIAHAEAQQLLGWQAETKTEASADGLRVHFQLKDKQGQPINDAAVLARFTRPTQSGHDREISLKPQAAGVYVGTAALELSGLWNIRISVSKGKDNYQQSQNITVP